MRIFKLFVMLGLSLAYVYSYATSCEVATLKTYANYAKSTLCTGASACDGSQCVTCQLSFEPWATSGITGVQGCFTQFITDLATGGTTSQKTCPAQVAICALDGGPNTGAPVANVNNIKVTNPCKTKGSIVHTESQVVGESIPIVGASFSLNYFTHWVQGRIGDYKLTIPLAEGTIDTDISSFDIEVRHNGSLVDSGTASNSSANANYTYLWDGNISSVLTIGAEEFEVKVDMNLASVKAPVFSKVFLGSFKSKLIGLGGWLPSIYAFYDANTSTLYKGDGSRATVTLAPSTSGTSVVDPETNQVYEFDGTGRVTAIKTGLLGTTIYSFNYDTQGRLTSINEPFSRTTVFTRDTSDKFSGIVAPKGQTSTVTLSTLGYLATVTNPNSETYSMTYGALGMLATFQKPGAQTSTFTYDGDGNLTRDAHSGGYFFDLVRNLNAAKTGDITLTTRMGRDTTSTISETSDRTLRTTTFMDGSVQTYDLIKYSGYSTETSSLRGESVVSTLSDDPRFGAAAQFETQLQYSNGSVNYTVTRTPTVTLSNSNDPFSILTYSMSTSKGTYSSTTDFDPSTKTFAGNTSLGRTSEAKIDSYERPTSFKKGNLTATVITYSNEKLTQIKQGARETDFAYNSTSGFLDSITNPLSQTTSFVYDSAGRVASKILPDLRTVGFSYDGNGNLTGLTPPGRTVHSFGFNSSELVGSYEPPTLSGVSVVNTTYSYDNDKNLTSISKPNGSSIQFTYDSTSGLLTKVTAPAGDYNYSIDSTTKMPDQIDSPSGIVTGISYTGRVPTQILIRDSGYTFSLGHSVTVSTSGLLSSDLVFTNAGTSSISYTYDDDELLTGAGDLTLTNDTPNGMLTATSIGTSPNIVTDSYTYNSFGEVTGYQAKYGSTVIYDLTLGRDGMGRINSKTQVMNSVTDAYGYTFDTTGRLTQTTKNSSTVATYGYDDNSNRNSGTIGAQTTTATYDAQDRMTAYNLLSFTYNANGDLTSRTNTLTSTTTSYTYDVFGNLTSVTLPSADVIDYEIDGLNRRIGKKINGVLQKRWVYMDQTRIAAELDSSGNIDKRFIYASKGNIPDYMIMGGENYRIISDHLGSPRLVVKVSDGTIAGRMDHDEYGRVTVNTNPGLLPFGFAGGLYDTDTGLVRFGARDYDSETGRWTSKDPILFGGGDTNLFGYTWNDPVNFVDPNGRAGAYASAGGQVVGPGAAVGGSVTVVIGNNAEGAVVVNGSLQGAGTVLSGGLVYSKLGGELGAFLGSTSDFANAGVISLVSPIGGVNIFLDANGNAMGGGISGPSWGLGASYTPAKNSIGVTTPDLELIKSRKPGMCPVK